MIAAEVIDHLKARDVTFEAAGAGGLRVIGVDRLTDREKAALKAHKGTILRALGCTPIPTTGQAVPGTGGASPTATGPLPNRTEPSEPAARECRQCARFEPYPFEPILGSCYALKRMQNVGSKPTRFGCSHFEVKEGRS